MLKDFFLNEVEEAILKAIKDNKLGQASEFLILEILRLMFLLLPELQKLHRR